MRTFIAIELPQEIKEALARLQDQLKASGADVKWVEPHNIHLTLKFLGERDEKKVAKISEIVSETGDNNNSFQARISCLGAFPKLEYPRVIWAGLDQGDKETKEIVRELEEKIAKTGIPKEDRPFSSHITLGRVRSALNKDKLCAILHDLGNITGKENLEFKVNRITLFKSTLSSQGPSYEALKEANLKTT